MAILDMHSQALLDEFVEKRPMFELMQNIVLNKIKDLLKENNLLVTTVEGRVKDPSSLAGKLELKGSKYKTLSDITDLLGCRVVTFYSEEVDKIASLIERNFDIDWENSVDKRKMHDLDSFGYMSLHYICSIPKELYYDEKQPEINEWRFEIQMRTALQHVWATAYHDTGYKSDVEVPKEYIRALSRLAGILEIADEQFSGIIGDLAEYRRKVKALVRDKKFADLALNGDTFKSYLELNPFDRLNQKIAAINKAEINPQSFMPYLYILLQFEFKTLADIEKLIADYSEEAYQLALLQLGNTDIDIVSSTIGIQNLCIVYLLKLGDGEGGIKLFYDALYGERKSNINSAKRTYKQALTAHIIDEE